jgi:hypothetical protein
MKFPSRPIIIVSFFILLLNLLTSGLYARDIILVENLGPPAGGELLLKILQEKFNIPRKLIHYKMKQSCEKNSEAIMQLCLKADGEMEIMKMNKYVVEQTLGAFNDLEEM